MTSPAYKPDAALMYGAQDENTDLRPDLATFATAWNRILCVSKAAIRHIRRLLQLCRSRLMALTLPTYKGDMGPYWEDGIGSDAYYAAEDRKTKAMRCHRRSSPLSLM